MCGVEWDGRNTITCSPTGKSVVPFQKFFNLNLGHQQSERRVLGHRVQALLCLFYLMARSIENYVTVRPYEMLDKNWTKVILTNDCLKCSTWYQLKINIYQYHQVPSFAKFCPLHPQHWRQAQSFDQKSEKWNPQALQVLPNHQKSWQTVIICYSFDLLIMNFYF